MLIKEIREGLFPEEFTRKVSPQEAREDFNAFPFYTSPGYWKSSSHINLLAKKLMMVERGEIKRLLVFMPPRHSKSENISIHFPAWYLGRNPNKRIILCSYGSDLACTFSGRVKTILEDVGRELFGVIPKGTLDFWGLLGYGGSFKAAGVLGAITGHGADLMIIDDPIKNDVEANSITYRNRLWEWWITTARSRLEPGASVIICATRWHFDDLTGRLIAQNNKKEEENSVFEKWEILSFPALAEENDSLGRTKGEALWKERYDEKYLLKTKDAIGHYYFQCLYQQSPKIPEGNIYKKHMFRYFRTETIGGNSFYVLLTLKSEENGGICGEKRIPQDLCWKFQTIDPAATETNKSNYFVCATWAVTPDKELLLLDIYRERAETTKHLEIMQSQYLRWLPVWQCVENVTYGLTIIQMCIKMGLPVYPLSADKDKIARSLIMLTRYEAGCVYHRQNAPWLAEYEDEITAFPNGEYDDQADVTAYAGIVLSVKESIGGKKEATKDDIIIVNRNGNINWDKMTGG